MLAVPLIRVTPYKNTPSHPCLRQSWYKLVASYVLLSQMSLFYFNFWGFLLEEKNNYNCTLCRHDTVSTISWKMGAEHYFFKLLQLSCNFLFSGPIWELLYMAGKNFKSCQKNNFCFLFSSFDGYILSKKKNCNGLILGLSFVKITKNTIEY